MMAIPASLRVAGKSYLASLVFFLQEKSSMARSEQHLEQNRVFGSISKLRSDQMGDTSTYSKGKRIGEFKDSHWCWIERE